MITPVSGPTRHSEATHLDAFLTHIATRERSQSRLSVAALTAGCCAAQLEAQCSEARLYRTQAPGPCDIEPLISALQRLRTRIAGFIEQTLKMESESSTAYLLPDSGFQDQFETQLAMEQMLTGFVVAGIKGASIIVEIASVARKVHRL